jgi:hypothetical protein
LLRKIGGAQNLVFVVESATAAEAFVTRPLRSSQYCLYCVTGFGSFSRNAHTRQRVSCLIQRSSVTLGCGKEIHLRTVRSAAAERIPCHRRNETKSCSTSSTLHFHGTTKAKTQPASASIRSLDTEAARTKNPTWHPAHSSVRQANVEAVGDLSHRRLQAAWPSLTQRARRGKRMRRGHKERLLL